MEAKWGCTGSEHPITLGPSKHTPSLSPLHPPGEPGFGLQMSNYHGLSYALFTPFHLTLFILYLTVCFKSELPFPAKNNLLLNTIVIQRRSGEPLNNSSFYEFLVVIVKCVKCIFPNHVFLEYMISETSLWGHTLAFIIPSRQWTCTRPPRRLTHFICSLELGILHLDSGKGKSKWPN